MRDDANEGMRRMTLKRARDFAVYIAVGIVFGLAIVWYGFSSDRSGTEAIGKWVGLTGTTLILFGYAIRSHGRFISRLSFWLVILASLVVHLSVFIVILENVQRWKVVWFVLAFPLENIAIDAALSATGHDVLGRRRPRRYPN
jgi:hypothetical protein